MSVVGIATPYFTSVQALYNLWSELLDQGKIC